MANTPNYLQPFSVISDSELRRFRRLEAIAKANIKHCLRDPSVTGLHLESGEEFTRDELLELLSK